MAGFLNDSDNFSWNRGKAVDLLVCAVGVSVSVVVSICV